VTDEIVIYYEVQHFKIRKKFKLKKKIHIVCNIELGIKYTYDYNL